MSQKFGHFSDGLKNGKLICVICLEDLLKGEQCHPL